MSAQVISITATPELESKALSIPDQADGLIVSDQASYNRAAAFLRDVVAPMRKEIKDTFDLICQRAFDAHRTATATRARHLDPVEKAESLIKGRLGTYELEQRRIAAEVERKAREESERLAAEIIEAEIEAAESRGATVQEVRAISDTPFVLPAPTRIVPAFERAVGVSTRQSYRAEADLATVLKSAATGNRTALGLLRIDEVKLGQLARAQGLELMRIVPGVKVYPTATVSARTK